MYVLWELLLLMLIVTAYKFQSVPKENIVPKIFLGTD